jgi:DnaK suppressor protein
LNKTLAKDAATASKKMPAKAVAAQPAVAPPAPKPVAPAPAAKPAPRPSTRSTSRAQAIPAPAPAPITNRFTDRFAPARAPVRNHDEPDVFKPVAKPDPKLANAWKTKAARDLTEAELLAMPEAEFMNEKQREFFRLRLQALKDDLLSNAGETTEHLREDTSIVPDPADRATIEEEHALELRTRDRERKLLKKIGQSLARVEAGEYGFCDETGEPIGLARLLARPTATLSLEAQQRREMKQKMFGD